MSFDPESRPDPQQPTEPNPKTELVLAKWGTRFVAWLVDFIIVSIAAEILFAIAYAPLSILHGMEGNTNPALGGARFAVECLMFFAYWTYFESRNNGQSIGKKLLNLRTTNLQGNIADVKSVAISTFGKAFLLPIDIILGWIFTNEKRQRLLSKAANTIVIRIQETQDGTPENITYRKE